mmetsp:Transcript_72079/g.208766  ORF Transcript_72079/g.208766 Transcript_72079/m.208766 type:complete len:190 (-) Transcript_72079:61-630(-)
MHPFRLVVSAATRAAAALWRARGSKRNDVFDDVANAKHQEQSSSPLGAAGQAPRARVRLPQWPDDGGDEAQSEFVTCWTQESLQLSEDSDLWTLPDEDDVAPSRFASPLDGAWVLCHGNNSFPEWLEMLTIEGLSVQDGAGERTRLTLTADGPALFGGVLRRRGDALVRYGRNGTVYVYLRSTSCRHIV